MTPEQRKELKTAALAADQDGQHIYTNPRDSNNWDNNETWHAAASPAVVLSLIAQVEALTVQQSACNKILREVLETVESSEHWWIDVPNRGGFDVEAISSAIAATPTISAIPGTKEGA